MEATVGLLFSVGGTTTKGSVCVSTVLDAFNVTCFGEATDLLSVGDAICSGGVGFGGSTKLEGAGEFLPICGLTTAGAISIGALVFTDGAAVCSTVLIAGV